MPQSIYSSGRILKQQYVCSCGFTTKNYDNEKTRILVVKLHKKKCVNKDKEVEHTYNCYVSDRFKNTKDYTGSITI
jgi:hypothetical protein